MGTAEETDPAASTERYGDELTEALLEVRKSRVVHSGSAAETMKSLRERRKARRT